MGSPMGNMAIGVVKSPFDRGEEVPGKCGTRCRHHGRVADELLCAASHDGADAVVLSE